VRNFEKGGKRDIGGTIGLGLCRIEIVYYLVKKDNMENI